MKPVFVSLVHSLLAAALLIGCAGTVGAQDTGTPAQPDNTKVNQRDRNAAQPTADQQSENRSDRDITQQIRKSLMSDKSLSTYAHNVKIVTQNGMVTLRGPVRSEDERRAVEAKAAEVVGEQKITSQLEIKPQQ